MPHLKAGNSEAARVICRCDHGHQVGAVGNVLVVELHRDLVVTWRPEFNSESERKQRRTIILRLSGAGGGHSTGLLSNVRHAAGSVFAVVKGDLRPAGSFHGDSQTSSSSLPGPDTELSWKIVLDHDHVYALFLYP